MANGYSLAEYKPHKQANGMAIPYCSRNIFLYAEGEHTGSQTICKGALRRDLERLGVEERVAAEMRLKKTGIMLE